MHRRLLSRARPVAYVLAVVGLVLSLSPLPARAQPVTGGADLSFGGGLVRTDFGGVDEIYGLALQTDGKVIAVGTTGGADGNYNMAIARYTLDGALDAGFGSGGVVMLDLGGGDAAHGVVVQADGRIVVAGVRNSDFVLLRLTESGRPDPTFGDGRGRTIVELTVAAEGRYAVESMADGSIVVGGAAAFGLARFTPDGRLDPSFGHGGFVAPSQTGSAASTLAVVDWGGGQVMFRRVTPDSWTQTLYRPDGSVDLAYGEGGSLTWRLGGWDAINGLAWQPGLRRWVLAGIVAGQSVLRRYDDFNNPDFSLGVNGRVATRAGGQSFAAFAAVDGPDGTVIAGGELGGDFALARFHTTYPGDVLLVDSFDFPNDNKLPIASGRPQDYRVGYENGEYVIERVNAAYAFAPTVWLGGVYGDAAISVDARVAGDTDGRYVALGCRSPFRAGSNGYRLVLSPARSQFWLARWDAGAEVRLVPPQSTPALRAGNASNRLELSCVGDTISASINGVLVASVQDGTYRAGRLTLIGSTFANAQNVSDARFDNLVVARRPPAPPPSVLLADNFDDPTQGRFAQMSDDPRFRQGYSGGRYIFEQIAADVDTARITSTATMFDDAVVTLEARLVQGEGEGYILVHCRASDEGFYRLAIYPGDGTFRLARWQGREATVLIANRVSSAVRGGQQWQRIRLSCVGDLIAVSIDGLLVGAVRDATLPRGRISFGAGLPRGVQGRFEAHFDNLTITSPPAAVALAPATAITDAVPPAVSLREEILAGAGAPE